MTIRDNATVNVAFTDNDRLNVVIFDSAAVKVAEAETVW